MEYKEYKPPKNPASSEALTVSDVGPGVEFSVLSEGEEIKSGRFQENTYYNGEEWVPAKALIDPSRDEEEVSMYEIGVVCARNGEWAGSYTVRKALEQ